MTKYILAVLLSLLSCAPIPIKKLSDDSKIRLSASPIIKINGEIDDEMAADIAGKLLLIDGPVVLVLNSPGGDVDAMNDIIEEVRDHSPENLCIISGKAASAAGIIFESPACTY